MTLGNPYFQNNHPQKNPPIHLSPNNLKFANLSQSIFAPL